MDGRKYAKVKKDYRPYIRFDEVNITDSVVSKVLKQFRRTGGQTTSTTGMMAYIAEQLPDLAVELFKKNWLNICRLNQERIIYIQHLAVTPGKGHLAVMLLTRQRNMMGY